MNYTEKMIKYYTVVGEHFGFPKCCIDAFCDGRFVFQRPTVVQNNCLNGFVPCESCATKIENKETTHKDLISNRKSKIPFKDINTYEEEDILIKETDEIYEQVSKDYCEWCEEKINKRGKKNKTICLDCDTN